MGALPGVMGAMMALEAVKAIARAGAPAGAVADLRRALAETRSIRVRPRQDCSACHGLGLQMPAETH